MRGPAMKLGQMLSLQGDEIIPAEFRKALTCCARRAMRCPTRSCGACSAGNTARAGSESSTRFDYEPVAAASIGQVHRARKHGGRELALKIQYPGVARSVDSDVDNLATSCDD